MATWITKPWIENALKSTGANSLPKIARAQILKLEETSNSNIVATISDKKLFVKAKFSPAAIEEFKRDNTGLPITEIQGGLVFLKSYSVQASVENELDQAEFIIHISHFKFAGGEGNTQFGDLVNSSSLPQLQTRLRELWRIAQLKAQLDGALKSHDEVYIPNYMERKLAEIPEWKPSYCPPQTSEIESSFSSIQEQICAETAESAEHETEQKGNEDLSSQVCSDNTVSSGYVPSSQKSVLLDQPLKGLVPEEPCSSSSETSQLRESSADSYSILQGRSSAGGKTPDVSIVHSSQNSNEFEIEQPLPHVTPERSPFNCSLTESQLGRLLETSVSFDEVTSPSACLDVRSPTQEGFTRIKPRNNCPAESLTNNNRPLKRNSSESSNAKDATPVRQPCSASSHNLRKKESFNKMPINERNIPSEKHVVKNVDQEVAVSSLRGDVSDRSNKKEEFEKLKVDFDDLFKQKTWNHPQTPTEDFSADLFEIDRRQSTKRKRPEKSNSVQKARLSVGVRQDSTVSPDSTSGSSQSQLSSHSSSMVRLEDLYSQQELLSLDTGSHKSPHSSTSPSILGCSTEEPFTLSTPNFDSLPSYQVPADDKRTPSNITFLTPTAGNQRDEVSFENKGTQDVISSLIKSDRKNELLTSTTQKREAEREPGTSGDVVEKALQSVGSAKKKRKSKARRRFNWFSDAY